MATRKLLDSLLGRDVRVKIPYKSGCYIGTLHKTNNSTNPSLYLKPNYYYVTDAHGEVIGCLFRASHVKSVSQHDIRAIE